MNVLLINHEFPPVGGGAANASYYIAREVVRLGHRVTVVTSHYSGLPLDEVIAGIRVMRLPVGRSNRSHATLREVGLFVIRALPFTRRLCRQERFDLVQTFFALPNGPIGVIAGRVSHVPVFVRLAGGDLPGFDATRHPIVHAILTPLLRYILKHADGVIANSEGLRQHALRLAPGLRCSVIHNGIDTTEFRPSSPSNGSSPEILFISRLIKRKGLQYLLPALAALSAEGISFHLRIVGDGPYEPEIRQMVSDLKLGAHVSLDGHRPHDQLPAIYAAADIFVLPSLNEGMANVVLEAAASGLPIVATDVPGIRELVVDGENGRVVPPMSVEALRESLREMLLDRTKRQAMGSHSRTHAEEFSWERIAQAYVNLWQATQGSASGCLT